MSESNQSVRYRARELGIAPGILSPGPHNAITDVPGICVGQVTAICDGDIRTGATAILSHSESIYEDKVPAGIAVANRFGKLMGSTQVAELGEVEAPIVLTNTLPVPHAADTGARRRLDGSRIYSLVKSVNSMRSHAKVPCLLPLRST